MVNAMPLRFLFAIAALPFLLSEVRAADGVDFNRDVRPILADTCFQCHGPDAKQRKAELRLDTADGVASVISKGNPAESELYRRITAKDPAKRMPSAASGKNLSEQQIAMLRRWIEGGAAWQRHWSWSLATTAGAGQIQVRNSTIDAFPSPPQRRFSPPEIDRALIRQ